MEGENRAPGKYEAIFFNTCEKSMAKDVLAKVQKDVCRDIYCSAICNHKKTGNESKNPSVRESARAPAHKGLLGSYKTE